jgi:putative hydrolase
VTSLPRAESDVGATPALRQDHHVHSTFSDGASTLGQNIAQAELLGLTHLGCVDHVRGDTTYVPALAAAVRAQQSLTAVVLTVGIEAKLLDRDGALDLPKVGLDGVDLIYIADHQFPWHDGPRAPRVVKEWLDTGTERADRCIEMLVASITSAMRRRDTRPFVLAHLFSILTKVGLSEAQVPDALLERLSATAAETATTVEISERWHCPSLRTLQAVRRAGAAIVCSTDSHTARMIGRYSYVRSLVTGLAL